MRVRSVLTVAAAVVGSAFVAAPAHADHTDNGQFLLRNSNSGGPADLDLHYGLGDDIAVVGDFNGDGTMTIGVRRGEEFLLRTEPGAGEADLVVRFGREDDVPIVGDFNGDGVWTVGVRRGDRFLLRNANTAGPADLDFRYGRADDVPIVGDFNGDGVMTVGVRRGDRYFLRNSNTGGPADLDFHFGRADDAPVIGDYNGDGTMTVGIRRGNRFFLRNSNTGGPADLDFRYGTDTDTGLVGDWDGSGTMTVGVHRVPEPVVATRGLDWREIEAIERGYVTDMAIWEALARCESNNNWQAISRNGLYYGGLQFHPHTWRSVGGQGMPHHASKAEQIWRAQILQARSGWGQWPACTRRLGLR